MAESTLGFQTEAGKVHVFLLSEEAGMAAHVMSLDAASARELGETLVKAADEAVEKLIDEIPSA